MAQLVTLEMMETTVREMTARYTEVQMRTQQVRNYLNLFMTLHLPLHFKNLKLTKPYVFTTIPNVDTYPFVYEADPTNPATGGQTIVSPGNIEIMPPVYCQGYLLNYSQDKISFYNRWPKLSINQQIGTGTGLTDDTYTGTIPSGNPFLRAQQDIFGNVTESAVIISAYDDTGYSFALNDQPVDDSNTGNLVNGLNAIVGTVNYLTGNYSFTATIPANAPIYASIVPYGAARPIDMLFYNQQIVLRPVPMQVYQIEFQISQQPTQLIADRAAPELDEWYLFICAGAARLIYNSFPDPDGEAALEPKWQEQLQIAQRRTLRQLSNQRVPTIFTQRGRNWGQYYMGAEYAGIGP